MHWKLLTIHAEVICRRTMLKFSAFLLCLVCIELISSNNVEISLQRYEPINGSDFVDIMLRVKKINRTTSVLSGTMNLLTDLDSSWFVCDHILHIFYN